MTPGAGQQAAAGDRNDENFASADVDEDEAVDRGEFMSAAQQAYDNLDSSSDAVRPTWFLWLTPEELQQDAAQDMPPDVAGTRAAMAFHVLDEDGDGKITAAEWKRESVTGMRPDWSASRFSYLDADGSGTISEEEYSTAQFSGLDQMQTAATQDGGQLAPGSDASAGADAEGQASSDPAIPLFIYRS